jgi:hypothetical protein
MYTYNTNRRKGPSEDQKEAKPEQREEGARRGRHKQDSQRATPLYYAYLCLLPILSARFFRVDEHAQGSPFREFLV